MLYTVVYALRSDIKENNNKLASEHVKSVHVVAHDVVNAQGKFLKENDLSKSDVKFIEIRLGA